MWKDYIRADPDAPIFVHEDEAFQRYGESLSKIFATEKTDSDESSSSE